MSKLAPVPIIVAILVMLACGPISPQPRLLVRAPAPGPERLWQDASIFQPVESVIRAARRRVCVEMYEFERASIAGWLVEAAERGVEVRVMVDPSVPASRATADHLRRAGIPVRAYPLDDRLPQIDHVKLLLTEAEALVGGMNWGMASDRNHDYALELSSPARLGALEAIFDHDWSLAGGLSMAASDPTPSQVLQTRPGEGIRSELVSRLRAAGRQVRAEVFVLTDPEVIAILADAARRGVQVRVLLDPNQEVNRAGYRLLRQVGAWVRWYPVPEGAKLHAKAGLFDGSLILGSANWSRSGLSHNHELDVLTTDPSVTAAFAARFEADWKASPP